jgi:hypothetical protein
MHERSSRPWLYTPLPRRPSLDHFLRCLYAPTISYAPWQSVIARLATILVILWTVLSLLSLMLFIVRYVTGYNIFLTEFTTLVQLSVALFFISIPFLFSNEPLKSVFNGSLICITFSGILARGDHLCSYCPYTFANFNPSLITKLDHQSLVFYIFDYHSDTSAVHIGALAFFAGSILLLASGLIYQQLWFEQRLQKEAA